MKTSCGAVFYTYNPNGELGIILGLEGTEWLPFKGCNEEGENFEETAIREIREETCGLVNLTSICLDHKFTSKRKHYCIGLCEAPFDIIDKFPTMRCVESRAEYKEKKKLKFFHIDFVLSNSSVHNISKASIKYYWDKLNLLRKPNEIQLRPPKDVFRKHSLSQTYLTQAQNMEDDHIVKKSKSRRYRSCENISDWRRPMILAN